MFRTAANPMDEVVVKATDENLVNENWDLILGVCDAVNASPSGPQSAVAALIKRLAHRNANVQLYTLELANALSQNCGAELHRELASRAFTEALLRLASDRNTHAQVKQKVMERMEIWTKDFGRSPELGIMGEAYRKLRTQQPSLMPPSKPGKREISTEDKRKEEDELQMALALSVQDNSSKPKVTGTSREDSDPPMQASAGATQAQQGTTAATVSRVRALYDFTPSEAGELAFRKNDIIAVLESVYKDWWKGSLRGQTGIFPLNYVEKLQDPTKDELERDAQMEAEVFGEIKNVERLLALLSMQTEGGHGRKGEREEEEISELYQRTLSIRPKLIELIGKYSQKKDDFTQLNEKFIKARRDYEAMLESSMAQPQHYQQYPVRARPPQMHPQQQVQPPYHAQLPAGYPQPSPAVGYGQPYASQSHIPPQQLPQDPAQRFYSPAPQSEAHAYAASPYAVQGGVPPSAAPAAFHFIPGGVPQSNLEQPSTAVRRKPSPQQQQLQQQQPLSAVPSEMGTAAPYAAPGVFQGQIRPNSIHTINSGNPQELATGGYESPTENRRSYPPPAAQQPPQQSYEGYPAQHPQAAPHQPSYPPHQPPQSLMHSQAAVPAPLQPQAPQRNDLASLPSRQRTQSFESAYSAQQGFGSELTTYASASHPSQPPSAPNNIPAPNGPYQQYQAYNPSVPPERAAPAPSSDDPGDYYR